ncbi:hypothetical protein ACIQFZ_18110 [Streptomyces sp. NPDC093064]|uniref:hypothetical protein n=1 Tax=Streptomyces sp. NPDC093064 TaxID=3366020 RepID=UPI00382CDDF6
MGIPQEDRLDYMCRQDMNAIESAVSSIRTAMTNVENMMPKTWIGKKADNWHAEHDGRMKRLRTLFDSFPAEENQLVEKARQKQTQMDRKMHGRVDLEPARHACRRRSAAGVERRRRRTRARCAWVRLRRTGCTYCGAAGSGCPETAAYSASRPGCPSPSRTSTPLRELSASPANRTATPVAAHKDIRVGGVSAASRCTKH